MQDSPSDGGRLMGEANASFIHPLAIVEDGAVIGERTRVWAYAHVRRDARVGAGCTIGSGATIDVGVTLGDHCKVQNHALLYAGVRLGSGVFVGPAAVFTNDRYPRAVTPEGNLRTAYEWTITETIVADGASIGAHATVVAGVTIGAWSMVGAGAVVTRSVADHALVLGLPAKRVGWVCRCGQVLEDSPRLTCRSCQATYDLDADGLGLRRTEPVHACAGFTKGRVQ